MKTTRFAQIAFVVALLIAMAAVPTHADTVTFSYQSTGGVPNVTTTGTGSFSFNGPLTTIGLPNLTAFSFNMNLNDQNIPAMSSYNFGLTDLLSFSAAISAGSVSALSLQTGFVGGTNVSFVAEDFVVAGLGANQASNSTIPPESLLVNTGIVTTQTPVPEPSSILLLASGLAGLAGMIRRKLVT